MQTNYSSYSNISCSGVNFHRFELNWGKPVPHFAETPWTRPSGPLEVSSPQYRPTPASTPSSHRAFGPSSVPDAGMQGLTWWRGDPEAVTRGGSQWGLQGEKWRKPRLGSCLGRREKESNSRRNYSSAIISQAQLADVASSVFISNLQLVLTHRCRCHQ